MTTGSQQNYFTSEIQQHSNSPPALPHDHVLCGKRRPHLLHTSTGPTRLQSPPTDSISKGKDGVLCMSPGQCLALVKCDR